MGDMMPPLSGGRRMRVSFLATVCLAMGAVAAVAADTPRPSIDERAGKWQILCFDNDDGRYRDCYVVRDTLAVLMSSSGYELVIAGHGRDLRPESMMHVHVDGDAPLFWREDDLHADDIFTLAIKQFKAGTTVSLKWTENQSGKNVRAKISLIGFTKAYRRGQEIIAGYEPPVEPRPHGGIPHE
jgi:hypothetical protein